MSDNAPLERAGLANAETLLLAIGAFGLYVAFGQAALHGTDWRWLVLWLDEPGAVHPQHPGYLPAARAVRWLLQPLELDVHAALLVFSALGAAIAVAGVHQATLGLARDRAFARTAALLAIFTPALFHFGTVVELHAPFAGVMAFAVSSAVRWAHSGSPGAAVRTGVLVAVATLMHATGQLLVPTIAIAVWWARRDRGFWRGLESAALFAVTHALVWGGIFAAMRLLGHLPAAVAGFAAVPDDPAAPQQPLAYLVRWLRDMNLFAQLPPTALVEWLLPFAPLSLVAFVAWRRPDLRAWLALFSAALASYLIVTVALVHAATDERGAYLLPLLLPAAWLALLAVPRRGWPLLVVLALAAGFLFRGEPGRLPPDRAFGRAALVMAQQQPTVFFVADFPEMDGAFLANVRLELLVARKEYDELRAAQRATAGFEPNAEQIVGWLSLLAMQQQQKGARLVITDRAVLWLTARVPSFAAAWPQFVKQAKAERLPATAGIDGVVVAR